MGPATYNCPGLTLDELPWGPWLTTWGTARGGGRQVAVLLIGGYTYYFSRWKSGAIECERMAGLKDIEVFATKPGDILLAQALLIELTQGKTIQDPNL